MLLYIAFVRRYETLFSLFTSSSSPHLSQSSASCEARLGLARFARTRAWSTASSRFLESNASVWAAASICRWHSSFREVTAFCCARRILLISSPRSLFSSFFVPSICGGTETKDPVRVSTGIRHCGLSFGLFFKSKIFWF